MAATKKSKLTKLGKVLTARDEKAIASVRDRFQAELQRDDNHIQYMMEMLEEVEWYGGNESDLI